MSADFQSELWAVQEETVPVQYIPAEENKRLAFARQDSDNQRLAVANGKANQESGNALDVPTESHYGYLLKRVKIQGVHSLVRYHGRVRSNVKLCGTIRHRSAGDGGPNGHMDKGCWRSDLLVVEIEGHGEVPGMSSRGEGTRTTCEGSAAMRPT